MNALTIFVKYPEKGKVKTRLAKSIGDKKAMDFYIAFLEDMFKEHKGKNYDLYVYISPPEKVKAFEKHFKAPHYAVARGKNLGEKIFNSMKELLGLYEKVVMIPSDVPTLKGDTINDAFFHLHTADIVIGPAVDGGFYLIGMKEPHDVLSVLDWENSESLLSDIIKIATQQKLVVVVLKPIIADIDTIKELKELKEQLKNDNESSTAKMLKKLKI